MKEDRKKQFSKDIINASEIGQFYFCSVSWFLQRKGFKPESKNLDIGIDKHKKLGDIIDKTEAYDKRSKLFFMLGVFLVITAIILHLFEVIL